MILLRLVAVGALAYLLGFAAFMLVQRLPVDPAPTDAIVVLTGGPGRIPRGLALLQEGTARRMLISGAAPGVRPADLAAQTGAPARLFACCIDIGHRAVDTRSNGEETAGWVRSRGYRSVRLVTAEWHMPRARLELRNALGRDIAVVGDPVPSDPTLAVLVGEYNKLLVRGAALLVGYR